MKIMFVKIVLIFIFSFNFALAENFKLAESNSININIPKNWKSVSQLFGVELMFLGPLVKGNRPVVTISTSSFLGFSIDAEALKKNESSYKEDREKWLGKYNGKSLEYFKYEIKKIKNRNEIHGLGFRYLIEDKEYIERSYYLLCKKNIYHIKTLILSSDEVQYKKPLDEMITSFECK